MTKKILTQSRLKELLHYDPVSGLFKWRVAVKWMVKQGDIAGHIQKSNGRSCISIGVDGVETFAHRLAFLYVTGLFPLLDVDHIDGNALNNAWTNLRDVPTSTNVQNEKKARSNNKLGLLGVTKHGSGFQAHIHIEGRKRCIGTFATAELAHDAYLENKRKYHPGCTI